MWWNNFLDNWSQRVPFNHIRILFLNNFENKQAVSPLNIKLFSAWAQVAESKIEGSGVQKWKKQGARAKEAECVGKGIEESERRQLSAWEKAAKRPSKGSGLR